VATASNSDSVRGMVVWWVSEVVEAVNVVVVVVLIAVMVAMVVAMPMVIVYRWIDGEGSSGVPAALVCV
jgi:hypothetical protein